MDVEWLYPLRGRWMTWVSFVCAIGIHIGAVALAKSKPDTTGLVTFNSIQGAIEAIYSEPEPQSLEPPVVPLPIKALLPGQNSFHEQNVDSYSVRSAKHARNISLVRGTMPSLRSVKATALYAPRPVYPYEARCQRITGSGVALLKVDSISGNVVDVVMAQSCGRISLDNATIEAFRKWRFKPGTAVNVQVPITYTITGASY